MSEDCDFRVRFKNPALKISKESKRKTLRQFRHEIIAALRAHDFIINDNEVRVRNEGQFMGVRARYPSAFPTLPELKPFLAVEFFLSDVKVAPQIKPVTTLVKQILGNKVNHSEFPVNSVAVIETAAEKWVGLTRRVATSTYRKHYRDPNLVRHLYDLYRINELGYFTADFTSLVARIVEDDRQQYKSHNDDYYYDPVQEIKRSLDELSNSSQWRDNWSQFIETMVYAKQKPSYDEVLNNLHSKTQLALAELAAERI